MKVLSWINFILGLWLIVAGFTLSTGHHAVMAEEIVLGIIIAALACTFAFGPANPAINWVLAIAGLWTALAPWVLGYHTLMPSRSNDLVVGIVVLILAVASATTRHTPAHVHA